MPGHRRDEVLPSRFTAPGSDYVHLNARSLVIDDLFPSCVVAEEAFTDWDVILFPEEEALVAQAVMARRREFTTVRGCARLAFARLGTPPAPIVHGANREPLWPPGLVGSMTHCNGYRACAVALAAQIVTIGIDAEPNKALPEGVLDIVARPQEHAQLHRLAATTPTVSWDRLLLCTKEATYKAWFPLTGRWLDFQDAAVDIEPSGAFTVRLLVAGPHVGRRTFDGFTGRWLLDRGLLVTAIAVPC